MKPAAVDHLARRAASRWLCFQTTRRREGGGGARPSEAPLAQARGQPVEVDGRRAPDGLVGDEEVRLARQLKQPGSPHWVASLEDFVRVAHLLCAAKGRVDAAAAAVRRAAADGEAEADLLRHARAADDAAIDGALRAGPNPRPPLSKDGVALKVPQLAAPEQEPEGRPGGLSHLRVADKDDARKLGLDTLGRRELLAVGPSEPPPKLDGAGRLPPPCAQELPLVEGGVVGAGAITQGGEGREGVEAEAHRPTDTGRTQTCGGTEEFTILRENTTPCPFSPSNLKVHSYNGLRGQRAFDHTTGQGYVKSQRGHYHDGIFTKRN